MNRPEPVNAHCWLEQRKCWGWRNAKDTYLPRYPTVTSKDSLQEESRVRDEFKSSSLQLTPHMENTVGNQRPITVRDDG